MAGPSRACGFAEGGQRVSHDGRPRPGDDDPRERSRRLPRKAKGAPDEPLPRTRPLAAALALAVVAAGTALAAQTAAFTGTFAGKVTEQVDGQSVKAAATGTGSPVLGKVRLGKSTLTGLVARHHGQPALLAPERARARSPPKLGKLKVTLATTSRGCAASEEDQNDITVSGDAKVNGGTLKFKRAKGSLHFSGKYDRKAGTFAVKLTGRLTY